ncbi:MAG: hypothetical protein L0Y72_03145 [Gemmataceae bacterium]|nr:hypothetical protein [Gemmataceae bacterium]MCI0738014.1 hypothetical protein [Gemmataceae bacterium]
MHWARIVGGTLLAIMAVLFLCHFVSHVFVLNGDALRGKVEQDRYYLGSRGQYTEVSEGVYRYSQCLGLALIVVFPWCLVVGGALVSWADRVEKRRLAARLSERGLLSSQQFAERYFGPDAGRIELAAQLRNILEKETGIAQGGLRPDDRLEDVSQGAFPGDPSLFMEIEDRLGVDTAVEDWPRFEEAVKKVHTFHDLVNFVASCPKKTTTESPHLDEPPRGALVTGLERGLSFGFGRGWFVVLGLVIAAIVAGLLGLPLISYAFLGALVSSIGLALAGVGLWLWLLAIAAFRARRKKGQFAGACFSLLVWGFAGAFVAWCGVGAIWGFFANWPTQ